MIWYTLRECLCKFLHYFGVLTIYGSRIPYRTTYIKVLVSLYITVNIHALNYTIIQNGLEQNILWYYTVWDDGVQHSISYHSIVCSGTVKNSTRWYAIIWCDMLRHDMIWSDMVWDMLWNDAIHSVHLLYTTLRTICIWYVVIKYNALPEI